MLFNSYIFIVVFLPLTLAGFYSTARWVGPRPAKGLLVFASLVYYGWWNPSYLLLILLSCLGNFYIGRLVASETLAPTSRKYILTAGISANLLLLGWYKYANFFVDNINAFLEVGWTLEKVILPIAISFFTFQQIAYLVDAYRGLAKEYDFLDYSLFICFFPQLIAGPIVHHGEMMPQFANKETYRLKWENIAVGVTLFTLGLFKKVIIADNIGPQADKVFDAAFAGGGFSCLEAWAGCLAYSFQLYFDFSGYSDMAIGLAKLFGIRMPMNFCSPYKAASLIDFWRHWHMTLSRFLKEYLYIPLGGNRKGKFRTQVNLFTTMLLGGLWHGAGWTFILWGALHGLMLVVNHLWTDLRRGLGTSSSLARKIGRAAGVTFTFFCVSLVWVLFRSESLPAALYYYEVMFGLADSATETIPLFRSQIWIFLGILLVFTWTFPNTQQWLAGYNPCLPSGNEPHPCRRFPAWRPTASWALFVAFLFLAAFLTLEHYEEFLYYQF